MFLALRLDFACRRYVLLKKAISRNSGKRSFSVSGTVGFALGDKRRFGTCDKLRQSAIALERLRRSSLRRPLAFRIQD